MQQFLEEKKCLLTQIKWQNMNLLRLREMHNVLQLPVFFFYFFSFFCQPYPALQNCKSVFLILKISNMTDRSFLQGIHVRIGTRIDISISMRPMITKFGKQVPL